VNKKHFAAAIACTALLISSGSFATLSFASQAASGSQTWTASHAECWQDPRSQHDLPACSRSSVPDRFSVQLLFEFDKYVVPDTVVNREALGTIDDYVARVKRSPAREYITIVGHTDAKGSDAYNMALGLRRANAVRDYFIAEGYPPELLAPAESLGKRELLANYSPFSVEQRRVVITKVDQ
jgi:OOP family OmpA-OmpF porin